MKINSIVIENFRPFKRLDEIRLGNFSTIVGKNDVGKSNILKAIQIFLQSKPKLDSNDINFHARPDENLTIEIAFTALPDTVEFEDGVETTFEQEKLLDENRNLRIKKIYQHSDPSKTTIIVKIKDYENESYSKLLPLKEKDLNTRCEVAGIQAQVSGRSITNKSKRNALREKASELGIPLIPMELELKSSDDIWKKIESLLPEIILFETDTPLEVSETSFQNEFKPIVKNAVERPSVNAAKEAFSREITQALQTEIDLLFERFKNHTDSFTSLKAKPNFAWDKIVAFDILGKDYQGIENSLNLRGSGVKRLLMVAFFQYLAEKNPNSQEFIFCVEEPENCLHPGLQRELIKSFYKIIDKGYQVIITTHSPVFVGSSPTNDLILIKREGGLAEADRSEGILSSIAEELGVEPSDQIIGYNSLAYVEGPDDILFWKTLSKKFKEEGITTDNFDDKKIGFIICGGADTLKHWIDLRAIHKLNKNFIVVIDSDKKKLMDVIPQRKLNWKVICEREGGFFYILRKREIENYIHPDVINRAGLNLQAYDDFSDMKSLFGENIYKQIENMSCQEILISDRYMENNIEHHELKEIIDKCLSI